MLQLFTFRHFEQGFDSLYSAADMIADDFL